MSMRAGLPILLLASLERALREGFRAGARVVRASCACGWSAARGGSTCVLA